MNMNMQQPATGNYSQEPEERVSDLVNHPDHYTWHPVCEAKDITQEFNYNLGTAIAYIWRSGCKTVDPLEDLRKAIKHLEFECARLEERTQPR